MLTYKWTESDNVAKSDDTGGVLDAEIKREADTRVPRNRILTGATATDTRTSACTLRL